MAVGPDKLNLPWITYTPTWTNATIQASSCVAKYIQMGKIVFISVSVVIKAGDTIGSNPQFSLPIAGIKFGNLFNSIGTFNFSYVDQGIRIYQGQVYPTNYTSDKVPFAVSTSNEQYLGSVDITSIVPFTFGNGDQLNCFGWYIAE